MKSTQTKNQKVDIREESIAILKTVALLEQSYGANYLVRLLKGAKEYGIREEDHTQLETFGALEEIHANKVRDIIAYLVRKGYLKVVDKRFGNIEITELGEKFLDQPVDFEVATRYLYANRHDRKLYKALKELRKELASEQNKPPFHIFTDYTMQCLVEAKPTEIPGLKAIPGIGDYKADKYGHLVLGLIRENKTRKAEADHERNMRLAHSPSHQEVKALFEAGMDMEAIAEKREVQPSTVRSTLFRLHYAGEIDLIPWIESKVAKPDLEKGAEYFRQAQEPRLKQAYEDLGMDYDTLRLCRLYVHKLSTVEEELRYAS